MTSEMTDGERFGTWLQAALDGPPVVSAAELTRRFRQYGAAISAASVSRWLGGARPSAENANIAGLTLGDQAGALAAAGRPVISSDAVVKHVELPDGGLLVWDWADWDDDLRRTALQNIEGLEAIASKRKRRKRSGK